jgi:HEAT repeat protein
MRIPSLESLKRSRLTLVFGVLAVIAAVVGVTGIDLENRHLRALVSEDLRKGCFDDDVRLGELEAAGDLAVPFLREQLRDNSDPVRSAIRWAEGKGVLNWIHDYVSDSAADAMLRVMYRRDRERIIALRSLLLLGPRAMAAEPELQQLRVTGESEQKAMAQVCLAAIRPYDLEVISNCAVVLRGSSQPDRFFLVSEFPLIWTNPPTHMGALIERLADTDSGVRSRAALAVAKYGVAASNAVPYLRALVQQPNKTVVPNAGYALGLVSPEDMALALDVMAGQQRTNTAWTGEKGYLLSAMLRSKARDQEPLLREAVKQGQSWLGAGKPFRGAAEFALWRVSGEATPEIVEGLRSGLREGIQRIQLMCLTGLREIGPRASNAIPELQALTKDSHLTIQRKARETLAAIERKQ